jgi:phospholipid/cholesterol/gamma-HCH transport system permease protein
LPKVVGALIMIPCLITISAALGIWGGRMAGSMANIIHTDVFDMGLRQNFQPYNVKFALSKAYTFAFLISSVPAYFGYYVKGGALEIGRASTSAVVTTCILILVADYILAALML